MKEITLQIRFSEYPRPNPVPRVSSRITREQHPDLFETLAENVTEHLELNVSLEGTNVGVVATETDVAVETWSPRYIRRLLASDHLILDWVQVQQFGQLSQFIEPIEYESGDVVGISGWIPLSEMSVFSRSD